jgi:hypothetical protein
LNSARENIGRNCWRGWWLWSGTFFERHPPFQNVVLFQQAVRPRDCFGFYFAGLAGEDSGSSIWMSKISAVRLSSARAVSSGEQVWSLTICERWDLPDFIEL